MSSIFIMRTKFISLILSKGPILLKVARGWVEDTLFRGETRGETRVKLYLELTGGLMYFRSVIKVSFL